MSTELPYTSLTERPAAQAGVTVGSTARADFTHDPAHDAGTASADTEANR